MDGYDVEFWTLLKGRSRGLLRDCTTGCGTDGALHSTNRNPPMGAKVWLTNWPVPPTQGCAHVPGEAEAEAECGEGGGGQQRGVEVAAVQPRHGQRGDQRAQAHHHLTVHTG